MNEKKEGCRPVRIHLAMRDSPLPRSIRQALSMVDNEELFTYVDEQAEADLIIADDLRVIEKNYSESRAYGYFGVSQNKVVLPKNVTDISSAPAMLVCLIELIQQVWFTLKPLEEPKAVPVIPEVPLLPNALRILVIEDTLKHQTSARIGLARHKLKVATGYEEAMKILGSEKFDVVLTDLQMPMSSRTLGSDAFKLGQLVPYGIMLMIEAAHQGAMRVAVVTDLNHHADWLSAAFDHFRYLVQIDGAKVLMMHSPMRQDADGEWVKDWAEVLSRLMKLV